MASPRRRRLHGSGEVEVAHPGRRFPDRRAGRSERRHPRRPGPVARARRLPSLGLRVARRCFAPRGARLGPLGRQRAGCESRPCGMRLLRDPKAASSSRRSGRSVSWCMTASGAKELTAAMRASASNTSHMTGAAPRERRSSALPGERVIPATVCPAATRRGTIRLPSTPVAPATKMRMVRGSPRSRQARSDQVSDGRML
jgi:hypothetical protein